MEGLQLKIWRLCEKIGAGACSDVYAGTSHCVCMFMVIQTHARMCVREAQLTHKCDRLSTAAQWSRSRR